MNRADAITEQAEFVTAMRAAFTAASDARTWWAACDKYYYAKAFEALPEAVQRDLDAFVERERARVAAIARPS